MTIRKRFLSGVLAALVMGMSLSSCAGQYALFNKVHPLIGNLGGKWIGAIVNFIVGPIVYPICLTADALVFNLIEFWTGSNIIAAGNSFDQVDENGNRLAAVKNADGSLSLRITDAQGNMGDYLLVRERNDFKAFDADGVLLSSATITPEELAN